MKTFCTNKYYDRQVLLLGLIIGLVGGGLLIWLSYDPFNLDYIGGYLLIINYIFFISIGLSIYKKLVKNNSSYLKRLGFSFFIYSIITIVYIFYKIIFNPFAGQGNTIMEGLLFILVIIAIGLFISSLLALCIKTRHIEYEK